VGRVERFHVAAPWVHTLGLFAAVLVVFVVLKLGAVEGGAVLTVLSRAMGAGLKRAARPVPIERRQPAVCDGCARAGERFDSIVHVAEGQIHDAVGDLSAIRGELQLVAERMMRLRRRVGERGD
jgi:hypothetical protein